MSYPEEYDPALKGGVLRLCLLSRRSSNTKSSRRVSKQFRIVSGLLNRYRRRHHLRLYRLRTGRRIHLPFGRTAGRRKGKNRRRVWIDSQTEEEILRGIKEAKDLKEYDNLAASDLPKSQRRLPDGNQSSRLLTLKIRQQYPNYLNTKYSVVSVGRNMTCVLGMVVRREREIREFVETLFYRVLSTIGEKGATFEGEWRAVKGSKWFESFDLYKENGFKEKEKAEELIRFLSK